MIDLSKEAKLPRYLRGKSWSELKRIGKTKGDDVAEGLVRRGEAAKFGRKGQKQGGKEWRKAGREAEKYSRQTLKSRLKAKHRKLPG